MVREVPKHAHTTYDRLLFLPSTDKSSSSRFVFTPLPAFSSVGGPRLAAAPPISIMVTSRSRASTPNLSRLPRVPSSSGSTVKLLYFIIYALSPHQVTPTCRALCNSLPPPGASVYPRRTNSAIRPLPKVPYVPLPSLSLSEIPLSTSPETPSLFYHCLHLPRWYRGFLDQGCLGVVTTRLPEVARARLATSKQRQDVRIRCVIPFLTGTFHQIDQNGDVPHSVVSLPPPPTRARRRPQRA